MIKITKGLVPFWDDYIIDHEFTTAKLSVNSPSKRGVVMTFDKPWDGNGNDYFSIIKDDGIYRMYYETWACFDPEYTEGINVCYAESKDGIHWERPNLGLVEYNGSKDAHNNATNYVAPLITYRHKTFETFEYTYYITTGSTEEIRAEFSSLK